MNPNGLRQPQIIRPLAAAAVVLALLTRGAEAQSLDSGRDPSAPCVSCLVIGIQPADLESASSLSPGSLEGVQLLLMGPQPDDNKTIDLMHSIAVTGARIAVLVNPSPADGTIDELVFDLRTRITEFRAAQPGVLVVIDADPFTAVGVPLDRLMPYVDAMIRETGRPVLTGPNGSMWLRLRDESKPAVETLIKASLVPGGERMLLPVTHLDWDAVLDFAARRPAMVEVTGARHLTVGEILARYQARQRRQDAIVKTTIATGTTTLLFQVPDFAAPITITADTTLFRGPDGTSIEERGIRVNGAAIAGGGATSPPELPLIDAERISTPPLLITLNEAYRYALDGEDSVGDSRCYVVSFEPHTAARGLARGRAWIDIREFTLRRLETIQHDLRGAIVSSEQVDEFGRVEVGDTNVWLPTETRIFQSYEGAGFRTPIHRTIAVSQYEVNSPAFGARLMAALASDSVMLRETTEGLRYLVRRSGAPDRSEATRGSQRIRSLIGGVVVDPNISRPLGFAGISYVNLNLFGRGAQLNLFFGGVFAQASWSVPSIGASKWQAHGTLFGIAAHYHDRVFRNGREQYSEDLLQQPASATIGVLRPLMPRLRVTADYAFDVTALERTSNTPALFEVPPRVVNHGVVLSLDADRGPWGLRAWWNPVVRYRWRPWGIPGTFNPGTRDYQRYGARLTRTMALGPSLSSRLETSWMGGSDLDRFSRYGFDAFENPLHGYPTALIRYDRGAVVRTVTAWTARRVRIDGFADAAWVHDPGWPSAARAYPGVGVGVESGGPFRTLLSVEWAYGFRGPRADAGHGSQTARITVYRGF